MPVIDKKCNRVVYKNKYERLSPYVVNWWQHLFEMLESDAAIKPAWRFSLLKEILPSRLLNRFVSILSVKEEQFKSNETVTPSERQIKIDDLQEDAFSILPTATDKSVRHPTDDGDHPLPVPSGDTSEHNPYLNFFKRRPDRAAIWRELPPLSWQEMSLTQKADTVAEAIASDFVNWIQTVGGYENSSMDVYTIISMFEIGSQINSATTLNVKLKEMPSITQRVANCCKAPERARRTILYRELWRDQQASKKKPKITAFGRRLPTNMQVRPPVEVTYKKWVQCERVPEKLETMAAVWQGITHLKSTRAFCEYLYNEHPDIKPPRYLIDSGMMDPEKLKEESICSIKSTDSFGNVSRLSFSLLK